jgi:hypothetical protein
MQYPVGETFMIDVAQVKSRCCSISLFMFQVFFHDPNVAYGETKGVKLVGDRVNA